MRYVGETHPLLLTLEASHHTGLADKCTSWLRVTGHLSLVGVGDPHVNPRFHLMSVGWNLELTREFPTPTLASISSSHHRPAGKLCLSHFPPHLCTPWPAAMQISSPMPAWCSGQVQWWTFDEVLSMWDVYASLNNRIKRPSFTKLFNTPAGHFNPDQHWHSVVVDIKADEILNCNSYWSFVIFHIVLKLDWRFRGGLTCILYVSIGPISWNWHVFLSSSNWW